MISLETLAFTKRTAAGRRSFGWACLRQNFHETHVTKADRAENSESAPLRVHSSVLHESLLRAVDAQKSK
jgi:hypothetical protein